MPQPIQFDRACFCHNLRRAARRLSRRYDEALRPAGLRIGQFTIMAAMAEHGECRIGQLAQALGMDRTTLNKDLKPLQRRSLISQRADPEDARGRIIALSERGRTLFEETQPHWQKAQAETARRLDAADWSTLRAALDALADM